MQRGYGGATGCVQEGEMTADKAQSGGTFCEGNQFRTLLYSSLIGVNSTDGF
ncbi:MAG: hypothetical protein MJZ81_05130 [Bacteroidales bacterium]|nr:hypothetical protein [Bacteroidales bacterium]